MLELSIAFLLFAAWTWFSVKYYRRYTKYQTDNSLLINSFWNNTYLFDNIPSVFPTLGIFCTALGITLGIWDFNTDDIQGSIPELLEGLRLAFLATMAGILGLIIFQKWNAIIQKSIDDSPNRPVKHSDELSAISELNTSIQKFNDDNKSQFSTLISALEKKFDEQISGLGKEVQSINKVLNDNHEKLYRSSENITAGVSNISTEIVQLSKGGTDNTTQIITAMNENNKVFAGKFDEFSGLLAKNNTDALVEVMKNVTEQFNAQMSELISRLVQENFSELNNSVQSMNEWQRENKEQISTLTEHFQKTTESFDITSKTLNEVAEKSASLVGDKSKLVGLVATLEKVLITDNKFSEITNHLVTTVATLHETTESFSVTTNKLNEWVKNERNFKDSADVLIVKLEEFRDLNSDVWKKYREEMASAVSIIQTTSKRLGEDLTNVNDEFYERLNDTLTNLDLCIQRFIPAANVK